MLPTIKLGKHDVTRLIVGGNPFCGNSHFSKERDIEMRDYYTVDRIKKTLKQCEEAGINTWQSRGDNFVTRVLNEYRLDGGDIQWIAQTASERRDVISNIHQIAEYDPIAIYHQGSRTDYLYNNGRFDEVVRNFQEVRDLGIIAGIGTHIPQIVLHCEEMGLEPDFYMLCLYNMWEKGEGYDHEDRVKACEVIRDVKRPFIAFKTMAAGRNDPNEAFRFALRNIKDTDAVDVGMYTKHQPDQVFEDARIVSSLIQETE